MASAAEKGTGYKGLLGDHRDFMYRAAKDGIDQTVALPPRAVAKRFYDQPIFDQEQRSNCVGQSIARHVASVRKVSPRSAAFVYWGARLLINETHLDQGAYIRDGFKSAAHEGVPRDDLWPDVDANLFLDPVEKADRDALKRRILSYIRLNGAPDYRACIAAGFSFVAGVTLYSQMISRRTWASGILPFPQSGEYQIGGHALEFGEYDDHFRDSAWAKWARDRGFPDAMIPERVYIAANSWSEKFGKGGYLAVDATYIDHPWLAADVQTARPKA
jgi:hypothetical protein